MHPTPTNICPRNKFLWAFTYKILEVADLTGLHEGHISPSPTLVVKLQTSCILV